jgi:hypothetical protein
MDFSFCMFFGVLNSVLALLLVCIWGKLAIVCLNKRKKTPSS